MSRYKIFLPQRNHKIQDLSLEEILYSPHLDIVYHPDEAETTDAVVVLFSGRNRIDPAIQRMISHLPNNAPIIGLEAALAQQADWPTMPLDLVLPAGLPPLVIRHSIERFATSHRKNLDYEQLSTEYQRRIQVIEAMMEMGINFTATLSHRELYNRIIARTSELIPAEFHLLFILLREGTIASLQAQNGFDTGGPPLPPTRRLDSEMIEELNKLKKPLMGTNPFFESRLLRMEAIQLNRLLTNFLIAPIVSKDKLIGFIEIGNREGLLGFLPYDLDRMEILTDFAALALENAYLYERTELLSQIDDLTGVNNFLTGQIFMERLIREGDRFTLAFLDLDGFKSVNKHHGHMKGNEALQVVSGIIRQGIRSADMACRFGGDEFTIIMPGIEEDHAEDICRKIIDKLESLQLFPNIHLSASVGLTVFPQDKKDLSALIHAADFSMYYAKSLGRGQIIHYRDIRHQEGESQSK